MSNSEKNIQAAIEIDLSKSGIVLRNQSGLFYTGVLKQTKEYGLILTNIRRVKVGINGISDLQYLGEGGQCVFLECKTETGKASDEQLNFIEQVKALGFKAGVVRSVAEARELL